MADMSSEGSVSATEPTSIHRTNHSYINPRKTNTTFFSVIASCKLHGIEPWTYLRDRTCSTCSRAGTRSASSSSPRLLEKDFGAVVLGSDQANLLFIFE